MDRKEEAKQPLLPVPATDQPVFNEHNNPIRKRQARNRKFAVLGCALTIAFFYFHGEHCGAKKAYNGEDIRDSAAFHEHHPSHHHSDPNLPPRGHAAIEQFLKVPNNDSALASSRLFATKPHLAGSPQDFVTAQNVYELFIEEFKLPPRKHVPVFSAGSPQSRLATLTIPFSHHPRAWIDTYYPVLNTPLDRHLEILDDDGNVEWSAELEEVADTDTDPDASKYVDAVPTFHGLSKAGDVRGPLIHVGYGTKAEYDALIDKGIDFTGSIVLARYGAIFRGLKIKRAQEVGAVGVLIYSDPADDGGVDVEHGFTQYPDGPARNERSVQRGSVQFISMYPGDPTTPGRPAYANVTREEALNAPSIPSLPISWHNARRLLELVSDKPGPSEKLVRLHNNVAEGVTPIWNTMLLIPGHVKDEIVVVGNHRDAWVLGATDPSSGSASLQEVVRGFADLWHSGWLPLRSILIASWDAEEYGLVGSTEYGEDFPHFIAKHAVAYINLDSSVSGANFHASGSPSLANLLRKVASYVPHPTDSSRSIWDSKSDLGPFAANISDDSWTASKSFENAQSQLAPDTLGVTPLGSGSDYTVFLQNIGVASSDGGFGGAKGDAPYHYHSIFDSERWQELYADPGFHRHVAAAQFLGAVTLELSDSIILPLNTTQYALQLVEYLRAVEGLASQHHEELDEIPDFTELQNAIDELVLASRSLDTEKKKAERKLKKILHKRKHSWRHKLHEAARSVQRHFGLGKHEVTAADALVEIEWIAAQPSEVAFNVIDELDAEPAGWPSPVRPFPPRRWRKFFKAVARVKKANSKLAKFEQGFISKEGIKEREWYKHLGVAPGKWLGYGATTFPALTEAITIEKNSTLIEYEAARLTASILALAERLKA